MEKGLQEASVQPISNNKEDASPEGPMSLSN